MNVGHLLIRNNFSKFKKNFPYLVKYENDDKENKKRKKPLRFFVEEIQEETLAWQNGEKIAKKLQIPININEYYHYASRFILGYAAMATIDKKWLIR